MNSDKYGNFNNPNRPENVELLMLKLLSSMVIEGITPHIIMPISTFNIHIDEFLKIIKNSQENEKYKIFLQNYNDGKFYDVLSILI